MGNVAKYQHGWNMTFTVVELLMIIPKSTYLSISLPYFSIYHFFSLTLSHKQIVLIMVVVSTRDFRTNQTKYLNLAKAGEHVVLKSRAGSFRIFPDDGSNTIDAPRDLMKELKNALTEVKEAIAGKRELQSADSLLDEL